MKSKTRTNYVLLGLVLALLVGCGGSSNSTVSTGNPPPGGTKGNAEGGGQRKVAAPQ